MDFTLTSSDQLGATLKGLRRARHLTQRDLGLSAGLLQKTVSLLETAPNGCTVESLFRYLGALGVPVTLGFRETSSATPAHKDLW